MMNESLHDKIRKDIVQNVDGFYYFWPSETYGMYSPYALRQIADILDTLNKPYEKELEEYFSTCK